MASHGSPELDADAEKLAAMGGDPGPTLEAIAPIYLIWSHEHQLWWGPDGRGYTEKLSEAGRYARIQALGICTAAIAGTAHRMRALPELPVRLDDVEEMRRRFRILYRAPPEPWE